MMRRLRLGTRGSELALAQTALAAAALEAAAREEGVPIGGPDVVVVRTAGDDHPAERLVEAAGKGFFTAELEAALLARTVDVAVHSLKDLPTERPQGLVVGACLPRAAVEDVLLALPHVVADRGPDRLPLGPGARVGSSATRREALLRAFAPDAVPHPLRGNVPTRVARLREGRLDAIVVARAGLQRLRLSTADLRAFDLEPTRWIPAPGQGAVALEMRADDDGLLRLAARADHGPTHAATTVERAFLRVLEGGCSTPLGAFVQGGRVHLGREVDGRWRARTVALPPGGPAPDEAAVRRALALLDEPPEPPDGRPLWRAT